MKNSFIGECASYLYKKYGTEISNIKIVLPSRRAALFFNLELSRLIGNTPIWQPKFCSIDNLFGELSGLVVAERLKLLVVLYNIYTKYHQESFDKFYYWGEMLLSDFEAIDNYMVDARLLFENSADIKDIELQFDYISEEDAEEIRRFWRHFGESRNSDEKTYFFNIWRTLYPIYKEFREQLVAEGIGYRGMICRMVAEELKRGDRVIVDSSKYALVGFNALSNTEKVLFDALEGSDFLWDGDSFYIASKGNEAGLFLRSNIERYGESNSGVVRDNFKQKKEITVIKSPSPSMECKYVWEFLEKCAEGGRKLGAETAIILTDESLLLPVLYSIPPFVEHFNVTAGYELRLTQAYSLVESILSLQTKYNGEFYYKDVERILSNPLISNVIDGVDMGNVLDAKKIYYSAEELAKNDFLAVLFSNKTGWESISDYLLFLLNRIMVNLRFEGKEVKEALFKTFNTVSSLKILIGSLVVQLSDAVFLSLLRKHLKHERISYEGEPLLGIQIMGILESRSLDFENVLILSVGEENFPSKSMGSSFIPSNLRHGYGLPTSGYHQAMYAYYFYRLLQRAKRIDISYVSMNSELSSGEPSRYIHQLRYAKEHDIREVELSINLTTSDVGDATVAKEGRVLDYINGLKSGKRSLSASSFQDYIECPMRFYYSSIERVRDEDEREKELDAIESGNVLHYALKFIYEPLKGLPNSEVISRLKSLSQADIANITDKELQNILGNSEFNSAVNYNRKTIIHYISTIVSYDMARTDGFVVEGVEESIKGDIVVDGHSLRFIGSIDRVDRLPSGVHRIIDYKSGKGSVAPSLFSLFDTGESKNNKPITQSLIYSLLYGDRHGVEVIPSLYHVREMNKRDYSPLLKIKSLGDILRFSDVRVEFEGELKAKLAELIDIDIPFYRCGEESKCKYCDFKDLCTI